MTGFFDCTSRLADRLQRFGYISIEYEDLMIKAHEFHYSVLENAGENDFSYKFRITKSSSGEVWRCGLSKKNALAGYPHVHFYSNLNFFRKIIELYRSR